MSVLDRSALDASPLADLHEIASELSIDGYRRLRRAELIDAILHRQDGTDEAEAEAETGTEPAQDEGATAHEHEHDGAAAEHEHEHDGAAAEHEHDHEHDDAAAAHGAEEETSGSRRRRGRRGGRGRSSAREDGAASAAQEHESHREHDDEPEDTSEELVSGVVELLANGSGFVRVAPPDPSDDDVYISSAQVKRCELVSGDRIEGPKRAPRRSERFASLIRIETINGRPAAEVADGVRFDDLPAAFPSERLSIGSEDLTLKAIEWLTPFGKGSRVTIVGRSRAGKSEALRLLAAALAGRDQLTLSVVLSGVRPEEISEWSRSEPAPSAAVSFAAPDEARQAAIESAIDQGRRLAARGADVVVLIDTLDGAGPALARRAIGAARNIVDGGSLTVIATSSVPIGGETTVIALDAALASTGRFPALDLTESGTFRPELLVGDAGAEAIARARAEAADAGRAVAE